MNTLTRWWICVAMVMATPTWAQTGGADQGAQEELLDVIVVTARYREESIQDIGVSVAAISGDDLQKRSISDFEDLARTVAGVEILKNQPNQNTISIRGVSNASGEFSSSAPFSLFIDDVAITSSQFQRDVNAFDLNRVEIVRGPQPTLFGEGSVGGTIRYFSNDPDLYDPRVTGVAHARVESIEDGGTAFRVENATTLNLIPEKFGVRLMGFSRDDDGFIDNPDLGAEDVNSFESKGGRAVILARPSDNLEIRVSAFFVKDEIGDLSQVAVGTDPDDLASQTPGTSVTDEDFELYSARITYDFGPMELTSVTGYSERASEQSAFSASNSVGLVPFFPTIDTTTFNVGTSSEENTSQEFRFVSNFDGVLNVTAGLYYQDREEVDVGSLEGPEWALVTNPSSNFILRGESINESQQLSGFAELTYDVSDRLRLIGGVRYVDEKLTSTLVEDVVIDFVGGVNDESNPIEFVDTVAFLAGAGFSNSFDFELKRLLPRAAVEYSVSNDMLIYANVALGARNGGLNQALAAFTISGGDPDGFVQAIRFDEDEVFSVEWGAKTQWLDDALTVNVGAFYSEYKDTQIRSNVPAAAAFNGPDQRIFGLEVESVYRAADYFTTFLNLSLLDAEFTGDFATIDLSGIAGFDADVVEGNEPINTPTLSFSAGYDVSYPLSSNGLNLVSNGTFQYVGERYSSFQNFQSSELPSLELLSLRLGLENERFSLTAFVNNVFNNIEETNISTSAINAFVDVDGSLNAPQTAVSVNRPRTFGIELTVRY